MPEETPIGGPRSLDGQAISPDDVDVNDTLSVHDQGGNVRPYDRVTFSVGRTGTFIDGGDWLLFHHSYFDDGDYRALAGHTLYRTTDFESFTEITSDILSNRESSSTYHFQDHIVLPDGTFVLYETDANNGTTEVWKGDSLTSLSHLGTAISWQDCGVYYDEQNGTVHIYPEGVGVDGKPTSNVIKHFTTPDDDLLNATQQADALDVSGKNWSTGDVEVTQIGGNYYMFLDVLYSGTNYRIGVARSGDLDNWSLESQNVTDSGVGGDMVWTRSRDGVSYHGLTEFSDGPNGKGGAVWRMFPVPYVSNVQAVGSAVTFNNAQNGDLMASLRESGSGQRHRFELYEHPDSGGDLNGYYIIDNQNNQDGFFQLHNGDVKIGSGSNTYFMGGGGRLEFRFSGASTPARMHVEGSVTQDWYGDQSTELKSQDLSAVSGVDGRVYRHDGSSSITADGASTSSPGYYVWSSTDSEWKAMAQF